MNTYAQQVIPIIDKLKFPEELNNNKEILKTRFVNEVGYYEKKRDKTKKYYNVFRFIVTTGSILLPAILSIGQMDPEKLPRNFDQITYWSSWSISLLVTISNGFLQLFSLDKNYFSYSLVVEQLKTEGWQFFGLSGKYEDYDNHDKESYKEFCKAVENIKRKQVESEFQGKGNNTKKKVDFNFDKKMKEFMDKSKNNEMFKPLVDTVNNVSDLKNIGDNIQSTITDNIQSTITDNIQSTITDNIQSTITDNIDNISNNLKSSINDIEDPTKPLIKPKPPPPPKPIDNKNTIQ